MGDDGAADEGGGIGGEEGDHLGDVAGDSCSPERRAGAAVVAGLGHQLVEQLGVDVVVETPRGRQRRS